MPDYDYICPEGHTLIMAIPFAMYAPDYWPDCPVCSQKMRRAWRPLLGVSYRTSGFYSTDKALYDPEDPDDN